MASTTSQAETSAAIRSYYLELLGREPDQLGAQHWAEVAARDGIKAVRAGIEKSPEHLGRKYAAALSEFCGYGPQDIELILSFARDDQAGESGFVTDFMGGRIRTSSLWQGARSLDGQVTPPPIPSDFHSEAVEWAGALKAVSSAGEGRYVAMELGAGLGPWTVVGGLAAKYRSIEQIRLYAVEADPEHFRLLQQNLTDNGFLPEQCFAIHGAVAAEAGRARWPILDDSREDWGSRPIIDGGGTDYLGRRFEQYIDIEVYAMAELVSREPEWDLLHIDVQGFELGICTAAIALLNERVRWCVIGTHSRVIDAGLLQLFAGAGWVLEHEKPTRFQFRPGIQEFEAMTVTDGVQVWRNPRLVR